MRAEKTSKAQGKPQPDLNSVAVKLKLAQSEIAALGKLLASYRATLEQFAIENGGVLELDDFRVTVSDASRSVFALKLAQEKIPEATLKPFTTVTCYRIVRVADRKLAA